MFGNAWYVVKRMMDAVDVDHVVKRMMNVEERVMKLWNEC